MPTKAKKQFIPSSKDDTFFFAAATHGRLYSASRRLIRLRRIRSADFFQRGIPSLNSDAFELAIFNLALLSDLKN